MTIVSMFVEYVRRGIEMGRKAEENENEKGARYVSAESKWRQKIGYMIKWAFSCSSIKRKRVLSGMAGPWSMLLEI